MALCPDLSCGPQVLRPATGGAAANGCDDMAHGVVVPVKSRPVPGAEEGQR
jgi:hypothetical protein